MSNVEPSRNPADSDDAAGIFRVVIDKFLRDLENQLPARVVSYDEARNVVTVKPLIMLLDTDNQPHSRANVPDIPVFQLGSGQALLRFKLRPGDLGWIVASDRDISIFRQRLVESPPNTLRIHDFSDSVFMPDAMRNFTINAADENARAILQNNDGSVRVSIFDDKLELTGPNINITGTVDVTGTVHSSGNITTDSDVQAGTVSLTGHGHPYSWTDGPGSGNTGAPNP